jgi:hypothetical protein
MYARCAPGCVSGQVCRLNHQPVHRPLASGSGAEAVSPGLSEQMRALVGRPGQQVSSYLAGWVQGPGVTGLVSGPVRSAIRHRKAR